DEIAAGDIHLPAAEIAAVHALRHRADDLFGVAFAGEHEGVGHARHRNVCVALAPSTAGRFGLEQRTRKLVLQVPAQHAVFDEHVAARRLAFVVDIERAAAIADRAIVDYGAKLACDLLSDAPAERRNTLAVEVGLEPVPHRFVQKNAGPSGTEH